MHDASAFVPAQEIEHGRVSLAIDIDQIAPDFEQDTANGSIRLYEWLGRDWCVLFTHRGDLEPVCLTEIAEVTRMKPFWDERGVKVLGLSRHCADRVRRWEPDLKTLHGQPVNFPLIADSDGSVAALYGLTGDKADPPAAHWIFVIDPYRRVRAVHVYPPQVGRNFTEILRLVTALQLTDAHPVQTPANWQEGDKVVVAADLPDGEARALFPDGWMAVLPNFRLITPPARLRPAEPRLSAPRGRMGRSGTEAGDAILAALRRDRDQIGAGIARKAARDAGFRHRVISDANLVFEQETGQRLPANFQLRVVEDSPEMLHIVLPSAARAPVSPLSDSDLEGIAGGGPPAGQRIIGLVSLAGRGDKW